MKYFCPRPDCRRAVRGFPREDNFRAHLLRVHGLLIEGFGPSSQDETEETRQDEQTIGDDIRELSWEQLAELVANERSLRLSEEGKRQKLEEELLQLKRRMEEREDLWLKALSKAG